MAVCVNTIAHGVYVNGVKVAPLEHDKTPCSIRVETPIAALLRVAEAAKLVLDMNNDLSGLEGATELRAAIEAWKKGQ